MELSDSSFLFASLIWGSVGFGYFIYGKKQQSFVPMVGGVLILVASYLASSAWVMSLLSIGLILTVHWLLRQGYC